MDFSGVYFFFIVSLLKNLPKSEVQIILGSPFSWEQIKKKKMIPNERYYIMNPS